MQSTLGAAWDTSYQRLIGTAIGGAAAVGLLAVFKQGGLLYVAGLMGLGLFCALLQLQISAYRFAGITLAVIMLPRPTHSIPIIALHRFTEVSIGIVVGMAVMAVWPEIKAKQAEALPAEPLAEALTSVPSAEPPAMPR